MVRKTITKKVRFEVFKRDSFTCQYCGKSAPDVVLEIDHVKPVSKGGDNNIINLLSSCFDCNRGKSDRKLSDDSAVKKQKKILDDLSKKREQIKMMVEWRESLRDITGDMISAITDIFKDRCDGKYVIEDSSHEAMKKLKASLKKYGFKDVLDAVDSSIDYYYDGNIEDERERDLTIIKAFEMIPRICKSSKEQREKPYLKDLYYIRGILKKRLNYLNEWQSLDYLKKAYDYGVTLDDLKILSKEVKNWTQFKETIEEIIGG